MAPPSSTSLRILRPGQEQEKTAGRSRLNLGPPVFLAVGAIASSSGPSAGPRRFGLSCPFWETAVCTGLLFVSTLEECGSLKRRILPAGGLVRRPVPAQDPTGGPRRSLPLQSIMPVAMTVRPFLEVRSLMQQSPSQAARRQSGPCLWILSPSDCPGQLPRAYVGHEHVSRPGYPAPIPGSGRPVFSGSSETARTAFSRRRAP